MNREIKFRAWDGEQMVLLPLAGLQYFDFEGSYVLSFAVDGYGGFWGHEQYDTMSKKASKFPIMQFSGLKDKNGQEIYEGDIVAIRYRMGDNKEWETYTAYRVWLSIVNGLELRATKLLGDDPNNQHPISQTLSFRYRNIDTDTRNNNYDRLAVQDTWGENSLSRKSWKENHYSNDIEVIGNAYENPELLKQA